LAGISILEARSDISVLFTDIQMPGSMDGLKLAAAVKGRWPPIKIVATSGLVNVRSADLPEGGRFIPKPYNPVQLAETLQDLTADLRRSMDVQGMQAKVSSAVSAFRYPFPQWKVLGPQPSL
jgi:CheY-like chemotaxis protein